jgi:NDP-sugar pyrophosphorylase family protein
MNDIDTVVILAGGLGTRLTSVVSTGPKVMAPICGKPFLTYLLEQVSSFQLSKIILCTGHLHHKVMMHFGNKFNNTPIVYAWDSDQRGTGGALRQCSVLLNDNPVLVMNGDSYCNFDFPEFEAFHAVTEAEVSMLLVPAISNTRYGLVTVDLDDKIVSFNEKQASNGPSLINAGIYIMNKSAIDSMPETSPYSLETQFFPSIANKSLYGMESEGPLVDIGTPESYLEAQSFFLQGK